MQNTSRIVLVVLGFSLLGCSDDPVTQNQDVDSDLGQDVTADLGQDIGPDGSSQVVGPAGATLELSDGTSLEIPEGALDEDVEIGMELIEDLDDSGYEASPDFVDEPVASVALTPHGTVLAEPVTLTLPFSGSSDELVMLRLADEDDTDWEAVNLVTFEDGTASISIAEFSVYSLVEVAAGSCPCFSGTDLAHAITEGASYEAKYHSTNRSMPGLGDFAVNEWNWRGPDRFHVQASSRDYVFDAGRVERTCHAWAYTPGLADDDVTFDQFYPELDHNTVRDHHRAIIHNDLTPDEMLACLSLMEKSTADHPAFQVGFDTFDLPAGEWLEVGPTGGVPLRLDSTDQLAWYPQAYDDGDTFEFTVITQPATATCTLSQTTGTITENIIIDVNCGSAVPTESTFTWVSNFTNGSLTAVDIDDFSVIAGFAIDQSNEVLAVFLYDSTLGTS